MGAYVKWKKLKKLQRERVYNIQLQLNKNNTLSKIYLWDLKKEWKNFWIRWFSFYMTRQIIYKNEFSVIHLELWWRRSFVSDLESLSFPTLETAQQRAWPRIAHGSRFSMRCTRGGVAVSSFFALIWQDNVFAHWERFSCTQSKLIFVSYLWHKNRKKKKKQELLINVPQFRLFFAAVQE